MTMTVVVTEAVKILKPAFEGVKDKKNMRRLNCVLKF